MIDAIFPPDSPYRKAAELAMQRASQGVYPTPAWLQGRTGQPRRVCVAVIKELERRGVIGTRKARQGGAEDD